MRRAAILLAVCLCAFSGAAFPADDLPFYSAARAAKPPVIDGKLTEACWTNAEQTRPFIAMYGAAVPVATRTMVCWDDRNLYVAFICPEPLMPEVSRRIAQGIIGPWEESVEMFFDSRNTRYDYLQLRVDVTGMRDTRRRFELAPDLNRRWRAAVVRGADCWTVEAAIPFSVFPGGRPGPKILWNANFNRARSADPAVPGSLCWSDTKGGFHSPPRFGRLVFTPYPAWLTAFTRAGLSDISGEIETLRAQYPRSTASAGNGLAGLQAEGQQFCTGLSSAQIKTGAQAAEYWGKAQNLIAGGEVVREDVYLAVIRGLQ